MMFSTPDSDNDDAPMHCGFSHQSGWWFDWCSTSELNLDGYATGVWTTAGWKKTVTASRMLVKLN